MLSCVSAALPVKRLSFALLSASFICLGCSSASWAQETSVIQLEGVLVTSTKKSTGKTEKKGTSGSEPAAASAPAGKQVVYSPNRTPTDIAKVGSSVSVLTEDDLKQQSRTYLKDYLEQLPGVNFSQAGPPGTTQNISLRGGYNRYVKVLVDGMDLSDPSSSQTQVQFEHLLVGDIARIEVLRGSQSTLYGGDAVAGVISINTKQAMTPGFSQQAAAEYGRYNTSRGAYTAGYASARANVAFTVQGVVTDGFSAAAAGTEDDGYRNLTLSGRGEYKISEAVSVFFAARSLNAHNEYDNPPLDAPNSGATEQHAGRVGANVSLFDGALYSTIAIQGMQIDRDDHSTWGDSWYDGDRVKGEYKSVLTFNEYLSLLAGADWERTSMTSSSTPDTKNTAELNGYYGQFLIEPLDGLALTAGARLDQHDAFGDFDTYRLTAAYQLPGTQTKLHASTGTGFRAPSLFELYAPYYGNPNVTPEESDSWDAGVEQGFFNRRLVVNVTYFQLDTTNLISYDPTTFVTINIPGMTKRDGVEVSAAVQVMKGLGLTAAYTLTNTELPDHTRLIRVPRHNVALGVEAHPIDKLNVNVTAKLVADTVDGFMQQKVDNYVLLGAKLGYEFTPGWEAYVRGENLLDEKYQTVLNYGTAGISVYGGLQVALPSK